MNQVHKARFFEQIAIMFGREPKKPTEITERAQQVHELKRMANKVEVRAAILKAHEKPHGNTWRNRRWAFLLAVNLLFVVSFYLDIQILEGSLSASRLIGFHLIDLNSALQVMLAHKHIIVNLVIGTVNGHGDLDAAGRAYLLLVGLSVPLCRRVCGKAALVDGQEKAGV
jgi:ferredoxin-type protein NapH